MSDNNVDFNGNGQINNPMSGDAPQADFGQSYASPQNDTQSYNQETQLDGASYGQPADYGQASQAATSTPAYGQPADYDQSADYGQPAVPQPSYSQLASSNAPSYNQYTQTPPQPVVPLPAYDTNGAYIQPNYGQPNYDQPQGQPNYGQQANDQSAYTQQPSYGQPVPAGYAQKSKMAAGLLGIFLGGFGVHNFYLGNTGKAITQLLLATIGLIILIGPAIAGIWGLVEGIMILSSHSGSPWHRDAKGVELQD